VFLGGGGGLLQVETFTAERYSPHWMNWVDTPARRPAARPANKTSPPKNTKMATATHFSVHGHRQSITVLSTVLRAKLGCTRMM
jgi:hypothetical protein